MKPIRQRLLIKTYLAFILVLMMSVVNVDDVRAGAGSLDSAVAQVQAQTGGKVLRASQKGSKYVIKVLMPSGVVRTVTVRAQGN